MNSLVLLVPHHGPVPQYEIEEEPVLLAEVEELPEVGDEGAVPVGGRDEAVVVELGGVVALHVDPHPDGVGAGLKKKRKSRFRGNKMNCVWANHYTSLQITNGTFKLKE